MVRVWLPDRPGALGAVASRIGAVRGDVIGIDILERGGGRAVDELTVDAARRRRWSTSSSTEIGAGRRGRRRGRPAPHRRRAPTGPWRRSRSAARASWRSTTPTTCCASLCRVTRELTDADWVAVRRPRGQRAPCASAGRRSDDARVAVARSCSGAVRARRDRRARRSAPLDGRQLRWWCPRSPAAARRDARAGARQLVDHAWPTDRRLSGWPSSRERSTRPAATGRTRRRPRSGRPTARPGRRRAQRRRDVGDVGPDALGQAGQVGGAERGRLGVRRAGHGDAELVGLESQSSRSITDAPPSTRSSATVRPDAAVIASTTSRVWNAIDSTTARARWARADAAGEPDDRAAGVRVPPRATRGR